MKYIRVIGITFQLLFALTVKADLLLGLHASGDRLAYAFQKTVRIVSIQNDSVLSEKNLVEDSSITGPIIRKILKRTANADKAKIAEITASVKDFNMVNLTFYQNHLYVGFRYFAGKIKASRLCFGVLKLSTDLKLINYYLFKLPDKHAFSIPPYFPLEFIDSNHLALPDNDTGKMVIANFFMSEKQHEIVRESVVKRNVKQSKYLQIVFPESLLMDPVLFSVTGACYSTYFQFPQPVLFESANKIVNDPFGRAGLLKRNKAPGLGEGTHLLFNQQIAIDTLVMLASHAEKDTLYYLVSSHDPERIYMYYYSLSGQSFSFRMIKVPSKDHYFILENKRQIAFRWKDKKATISVFHY